MRVKEELGRAFKGLCRTKPLRVEAKSLPDSESTRVTSNACLAGMREPPQPDCNSIQTDRVIADFQASQLTNG